MLIFRKIMLKAEPVIEETINPTVVIREGHFNPNDMYVIYMDCQLPTNDTSFKAFMDYRHITDKTSEQWALQQLAYTDENGLRKIDNYYCVALGSYFADSCGEELLVVLDNGQVIPVIVADIKADNHTNTNNQYTPLKDDYGQYVYTDEDVQLLNMIEFIVEEDSLSSFVKNSGDISDVGNGADFAGNIKMIFKISKD